MGRDAQLACDVACASSPGEPGKLHLTVRGALVLWLRVARLPRVVIAQPARLRRGGWPPIPPGRALCTPVHRPGSHHRLREPALKIRFSGRGACLVRVADSSRSRHATQRRDGITLLRTSLHPLRFPSERSLCATKSIICELAQGQTMQTSLLLILEQGGTRRAGLHQLGPPAGGCREKDSSFQVEKLAEAAAARSELLAPASPLLCSHLISSSTHFYAHTAPQTSPLGRT
jgi:hypothetical protein